MTGGSLWSTTLRACVSCWWDWAMWRCSVSATRAAGRCGCMCVAGRRGRRVGAVAVCCGPTVSGRWCWWTSRRSAAGCGWCGTSAAGAAPATAARRAASLSRRRRSRRRGRCWRLARRGGRHARPGGAARSKTSPRSWAVCGTPSTLRSSAGAPRCSTLTPSGSRECRRWASTST